MKFIKFLKEIDFLRFFILVSFVFFVGCITIKSSDLLEDTEELEVEVLRLTTEKIQVQDGISYIIVSFPKTSKNHEFIFDEEKNEWIAIAILEKNNQ